MKVRNHMAILRNLRNIQEIGVSQEHWNKIKKCFTNESWAKTKVLPFRFISAAKYAPQLEPEIEIAMLKCLEERPKMPGHTVLLVDVSGSMDSSVSNKSDITRMEAACGVAMLLREICEQIDIYSFSMKLVRIPARHGFALKDAIVDSQSHSGTPLGIAVESIYANKSKKVGSVIFHGYGRYDVDYQGQNLRPDRLIVITDEQSSDPVQNPIGRGYMINVASYQNGVGYGPWNRVDGWSEAVIDYITEYEKFMEE